MPRGCPDSCHPCCASALLMAARVFTIERPPALQRAGTCARSLVCTRHHASAPHTRITLSNSHEKAAAARCRRPATMRSWPGARSRPSRCRGTADTLPPYGSILQAAWSFMLAARARGRAGRRSTCSTSRRHRVVGHPLRADRTGGAHPGRPHHRPGVPAGPEAASRVGAALGDLVDPTPTGGLSPARAKRSVDRCSLKRAQAQAA